MTNSAYAKTMEMDFCIVFCGLVKPGDFQQQTVDRLLNMGGVLECEILTHDLIEIKYGNFGKISLALFYYTIQAFR